MTLSIIQICLDLSKFEPLENVKSSGRESPVNYASQFEQKGYVVPYVEYVLTQRVVLVNHKTTFSEFWHSLLQLESRKNEVNHKESVEDNQSRIFTEFVAKCFLSLYDFSAIFLLIGHFKKDEPMYKYQHSPKVVNFHDSFPRSLSVNWSQSFFVGFELNSFFLITV